ncbi:MAG: flavin reductase family protein, partial [Thermoplasmata archaeon]|nr:flavin reductase family protein [Candidatus Sysuiplasma superficiale]
ECTVVSSFRAGDHTAFIGKVLNAYCDAAKRPLIYRGGKYYRIGELVAKR